MNILIAILCGILYFLGTSRVFYGMTQALGSPILYGLILGLIYGNVEQGLIIGGTIQLMYLGMIATGGNIPADEALAGIIAIPIALQSNLSTELAVGIAVPFGVLGVLLDQIRRTTNAYWISKADKYVEEKNYKGIFHCAITYPTILVFFLRFVPVFIITLLGANAVEYLIDALPKWVINGFNVAGGMLPAMGFAIILLIIGKKEIMPYFFIGFFAVAYLGINTMGAAVFGTCIAVLIMFNSMNKDKKGVV
ncbi:PTS sorbose transporter subunit IIC [Heyndrickxia sporothermodurans]|uniref:PTS mannose/fructose/sorbose/N-acetylgalactosamine transporter subunit IIC n=1 Tax=Heyndrickxia sporothermodurans TaxID=46224 RepID=UPI000D39CB32|nr:PTS sugar transporter subunit IIC [Heyndrickxia sporothermodurans]PTY79320.1 PTS sorbose transporter subunit IIC [Heyndrickxia sporothermodurans]